MEISKDFNLQIRFGLKCVIFFLFLILIKSHIIEYCCFLFATSDLAFKIDERKRFSRVVCYFIVIVELDENFEVEFFVRFKLDTTWKDGAMFTIGYLDHVRRPDEIVNGLSVFLWFVHNFILFTFTVTQLNVTEINSKC